MSGLADPVAWHDLECGRYVADLALWHELAASARGGAILEVGAGTGRVALSLARAGHRVVALDRDPVVLAALRERAAGLGVRTLVADARDFVLDEPVALVLAPMQAVQLLGGPEGRGRFLAATAAHLGTGGLLAAALATGLEPFGPDDPLPAPDVAGELVSQPVGLRQGPVTWTIERLRRAGAEEARDEISLDRVSPAELEREATGHGLVASARRHIGPTAEHVGSEVVVLARG